MDRSNSIPYLVARADTQKHCVFNEKGMQLLIHALDTIRFFFRHRHVLNLTSDKLGRSISVSNPVKT